MNNKQVLIDQLPTGKLAAENYKLVDGPMPEVNSGEVLIKTKAFAITAGARAGLQGSASYAGAPTTGIVMNGTGVGEVVTSESEQVPVGAMVVGSLGWRDSLLGPLENVDQFSGQLRARIPILEENQRIAQ